MNNKFTVMESEENTVLELIEELGGLHNNLVDDVEGKTDLFGDHKGSWQGLSKPTLSEEGMRATVEKHDVEINSLNGGNVSINVLKPPFGVVPLNGDGIIDNTNNLQAMLDNDNISELIFPKGKYKISGNIFIGNNKKLIGLKDSEIYTDSIIQLGSNNRVDGLTFKTITPKTVGEKHFYNLGVMLDINNASHTDIINCKGVGLNIVLNNSHYCNIKNNDVEIGHSPINGGGIRGGVQLKNSCYNIIEQNKLYSGIGDGVVITENSNYNKIRFNECFNNGFTGVFTAYSIGLIVEGNICYGHYAYDGLDINLPADIETSSKNYNAKIINNTCYNNHLAGILVLGSNVLISGNTCYNNGLHGIATGQRSGDSSLNERIICTNNVCYDNCQNDGIANDRQANIWLDKVKSCIASSNHCTQTDKQINFMIFISGEKLSIVGNIVNGNYKDPYPIKWMGTHIQLAGNIGNEPINV